MINHNDYFYKGYDPSNKNRIEQLVMEYSNPYGCNLGATSKRKIDLENKLSRTSQDCVKNAEFNKKKN